MSGDPAEDAQYLRDSNIPALVNDMIVQVLNARPADPIACLQTWMASDACDRSKYGPGKGEGAPAGGGGAAAAPPAAAAGGEAEKGGGEEEEDDPAEDLHDLSSCEGKLHIEIQKAVKKEGKERLDLSKNMLTSLPECLLDLPQVKSLSVEENQLTPALFDQIMKMPQLEYLNISDNSQLKMFPEGFGAAMKNLKKIDAYKCAYTGPLSVELCKIPSLTYINFYNNGILKLPPEIKELENLTELNCASNKMMAVMPGQFDNMKKLKRLALFWNRLIRIPSLAPLGELKELQLNGNQLPEMPELGVHPNLENINLSENKMTTLHASLFDQPELDEFSAGKNQLTNATILDGWAKLPKIRKIVLPSNQLTEFPSIFLDLPHLKVLELNSNQIASLPEDIDRFQNKTVPLECLFLAENKFTKLPQKLTECKAFMRLALKACPLDVQDETTQTVYKAMESMITGKGKEGKFIDGKRQWPAKPSGPTSLGIAPAAPAKGRKD